MAQKIAIVTGGTSGIGLACAQKFAADGAHVVITGRSADKGQAGLARIETADSEKTFLQADMARESEVRAIFETIRERFGRLDQAFNNAGISLPPVATAAMPEADWDLVMDVNVKGVWLAMKYEIPLMLDSGGGAIVNTASIAGVIGIPRSAAYTASKHAIIGLTKSAALEYAARGIRVNAVSPGFIETDMTRRNLDDPGTRKKMRQGTLQKRIGTSSEVAEAVVWLCSDAASYVNATNLMVDDGTSEQIVAPFNLREYNEE